MLPPEVREWLLLNPIMQGLELARAAFSPGYTAVTGLDLGYVTAFAFVSFFFGLALHVRFARRLLMQ
jgi:capsular polysaccharide transport system permease protein